MTLLTSVTVRFTRLFPKEFASSVNLIRFYSDDPPYIRIDRCPGREQIGFGFSGEKDYYDRTDLPCPAVRYKKETPEIKALHEKEKGDWHKLTLEEKKKLYRSSFRLTFAEIEAPTGRYKSYFGWAMVWYAVALWLYMLFYWCKNRGLTRPSLYYENRQAQLQRLIAMKYEPVHGLSSKWDYEKDDWK